MTSSASVSPHIDSQEQTDSRKSKSMSPSCSSGFDENRQNGTESLPNKRKNEILKESTQLIVIDVRWVGRIYCCIVHHTQNQPYFFVKYLFQVIGGSRN